MQWLITKLNKTALEFDSLLPATDELSFPFTGTIYLSRVYIYYRDYTYNTVYIYYGDYILTTESVFTTGTIYLNGTRLTTGTQMGVSSHRYAGELTHV